ncbi:hypothetical protein QQF64_025863 [Cirrhinus molitorella]|uniref:AIG1-type G domain-containing protein n=1 Tax=Cirrhinus molitorella TaxID=172907 RepID=A0ABR3NRQ1_9TELE
MAPRTVTRECSAAHTTVSGRPVTVVDTPGFFDTGLTQEETMTNIMKSVSLSSPGPHAFLILLRVGRFTCEEQQIPKMIEMMFGQEVSKYSIILFSCGDLLEEQSVEKLIGETRALKPGHEEEPPPPLMLEEGSIYAVKEILRSRRRGGQLEYLVDWEGYGPEERSWVSRSDILDPTLMEEFHSNHQNSGTSWMR